MTHHYEGPIFGLVKRVGGSNIEVNGAFFALHVVLHPARHKGKN